MKGKPFKKDHFVIIVKIFYQKFDCLKYFKTWNHKIIMTNFCVTNLESNLKQRFLQQKNFSFETRDILCQEYTLFAMKVSKYLVDQAKQRNLFLFCSDWSIKWNFFSAQETPFRSFFPEFQIFKISKKVRKLS